MALTGAHAAAIAVAVILLFVVLGYPLYIVLRENRRLRRLRTQMDIGEPGSDINPSFRRSIQAKTFHQWIEDTRREGRLVADDEIW
ncbi:hypothetical protein UA08_09172 [Talaromyces atroroseus]|uniref:Uncharacterized protein n=1 Tax=Talaromyces atroroseus TaxID=1441469 RepID=A0A1Q5Q6W4_TALAT|nr:hypothetical protein UA08_09172 [Talaromyces atroroseus]OKL55587.1 hypothetical protein UA08_09172 [Talaromyces atroroseus]